MNDQTERPYQLTDTQIRDICAALTNQGERYSRMDTSRDLGWRYIDLADDLNAEWHRQQRIEDAQRRLNHEQ